jgi:hypothetical protein
LVIKAGSKAGVTGIYQLHSYEEEKRNGPLDKWAKLMIENRIAVRDDYLLRRVRPIACRAFGHR